MILFKAQAILRVQHFELREKSLPATDREDFYSSTESTTSTSLTHNIASDGKSKQVVAWFLNLFFQYKNDDGVGVHQIDVPKYAVFAVQPWNSMEYPPA